MTPALLVSRDADRSASRARSKPTAHYDLRIDIGHEMRAVNAAVDTIARVGSKRVLILSAVDLEARALARALKLKRGAERGAWHADKGLQIDLHVVGVRAIRLPKIEPPKVDWVILAGMAGGLDPSLKTGELVMKGAPDDFRPRTPFRIGTLHTANQIVSTPTEKAALFDSTGALAVDMESAMVRPFAAALGAGFIDMRVVLDTADQVLPAELAGLVDPFGNAKPLAAAAIVFRNPSEIRKLLRLNRSTRTVLPILAAAVADLVGYLKNGDDKPLRPALGASIPKP